MHRVEWLGLFSSPSSLAFKQAITHASNKFTKGKLLYNIYKIYNISYSPPIIRSLFTQSSYQLSTVVVGA